MELGLQVGKDGGEDAGDVVPWTVQLAEVLGDLDGIGLARADAGEGPAEGAKGLPLGSLFAHLPTNALGRVVEALRAFALRTERTVKVTLDGETLEITGASPEQQDKVVEAWLARHAVRA